MQNRYTGDIGDFSKLGLLRALRAQGLSIGLNWYLSPDETHNNDGCHIDYLKLDKFRFCDEGLWRELGRIASGQRTVSAMEHKSVLDATFFSDMLDFSGKSKQQRHDERQKWFARSLSALSEVDVVCVDPDNGLVVPSALASPKENKFVLPGELASYYACGSSVIYYQHKARKGDGFYIEQHRELLGSPFFPDATGLALKFKTTSQRYYFCIVQPQHLAAFEQAISGMLAGAWSEHFHRLEM